MNIVTSLISAAITGLATVWIAGEPANGSTMIPIGLETNDRARPLGIDEVPPRLSWKLDADGRRGAAQSSYQIQAAAFENGFTGTTGLLWDSGRVDSPETTNIRYSGKPLKTGMRVWWRVRAACWC